MKNKVMLFSSNGKPIKEISDDSIKIVGASIKVGDKGNINASRYVSFLKTEYFDETKEMKELEVYIYDQIIFKGNGHYSNGGGHSSPSITAEIEGEFFVIKVEGSLFKEITIISDCFL